MNTRKLVYDPTADEDVVKSLMQAQHKAMLKDLKSGKFSEKIGRYFGDNPELQAYDAQKDAGQRAETQPFEPVDPSDLAAVAAVGTAATVQLDRAPSEVSAAFSAVQAPIDDVPTARVTARTVVAASAPPPALPPPAAPRPTPPPPPRAATPPPATRPQVPAAVPARRAVAPGSTPRARKPGRSGGVVVSRPAVIVGAPPRVIGNAPAAQPVAARARVRKTTEDNSDSLFGQGLISEKSLDEVILAYLSDDGSED